MSPDFSTQPRRGAPNLADLALLFAALVAMALAARSAWAARAELRRARERAGEARREADDATTRARGIESRDGGPEALSSRVVLTSDAPPPRVIADVAALLPADVRLDGIALSYGGRLEVELRVVARGAPSYDLFLKHLEESPLFAEIVPGAENRDGEVVASVRAIYRVPGGFG